LNITTRCSASIVMIASIADSTMPASWRSRSEGALGVAPGGDVVVIVSSAGWPS
jgi:hypothetical protein